MLLSESQLEYAEMSAQQSVVGNPPRAIRCSSHDEVNATLAELTFERLRSAEKDKKLEELAERRRSEAERLERNRLRADSEAQAASMDKQLRAAMQSHLRAREASRNKATPLSSLGEQERLGSNSSYSVWTRFLAERAEAWWAHLSEQWSLQGAQGGLSVNKEVHEPLQPESPSSVIVT